MQPLKQFLIAALLCDLANFVGQSVAAPLSATSAVAANSGSAMHLAAAEPPAPSQGALFDRLAGTWDVSYEIYDKDGKVRLYHGQVVYSRILDGAALQEIWTSDAHDKEFRPYGTTIGFHDSKRQRWTEVWVFPEKGYTSIVSGGELDGRIVLTGRDEDGTIQRWSLSDIQSDSFVWHFESSNDDGKTWRLLGVNQMRRHGA